MHKCRPFVALALVAAACSSDPTGTKATADLTVLRVAGSAPSLANAADSFWAVKGEDREITIWFHAAPGASDSSALLHLRVSNQSLFRRPDGTLIADGDSVLIHVTVPDPTKLVVAFEPAGLLFSTTDPARLEFEFVEADSDLNDDGSVDGTDDALRSQLHLWRQEQPADPWAQLSTVLDLTEESARAEIFGFTNYALAF
jgi:hypothetical protein